MAAGVIIMARNAVARVRLAKMLSGMIGCSVRLSSSTKATSSTTPPTMPVTASGSPQP